MLFSRQNHSELYNLECNFLILLPFLKILLLANALKTGLQIPSRTCFSDDTSYNFPARDHGIPSYNNYRALCNLKRASSFDDLAREIPPEIISRFKRIYATVDDIDLFPGGMSERPLQGGLVGPTFACIISIQFRQLRKCDRFW